MTVWGWIAIGALGAAVLWIGLALAGAVRELASLRSRLEVLEVSDGDVVRIPEGLPVGSAAPAWRLRTPDGRETTSASLRDVRHLMLFADADCRACDDLVPAVIDAASHDRLVPVVVVGRGEPSDTPAAWRCKDDRVIVGVEHDEEVSRAFGTEVSPHAFLIDEGGFVVAQGGPLTLEDVRELVAEADGLRIVAGASDG